MLLQTRGLTKQYGGLTAVNRVDFSLPSGSICSIIGPNGAGKTTFFNLVAGLCPPTSGSITFQNHVLAGRQGSKMRSRPAHQIARLGMARTFQNIRLFGAMSVLENVLVGMHTRFHSGHFAGLLRFPSGVIEERRAAERASHWLSEVGLSGKQSQMARSLAYGDQRLLEMARAMASEPSVLLLDEPGAGMNPAEKDRLKTLVGLLRERHGVTILLIEHDMKFVMGISERVTVLDHGEKIAEGTPQEISRDPRVIEAYLGKTEN